MMPDFVLPLITNIVNGVFTGIVANIIFGSADKNLSPILVVLFIPLFFLNKKYTGKELEKIPIVSDNTTEEQKPNGRLSWVLRILLIIIAPIIIGVVIGMATTHGYYLNPDFEIITPKENEPVDLNITVEGHGAIPESEIKVFVIDDHGDRTLQGATFSDARGNWELNRVIIGRPGERDKGKIYVIYAIKSVMNYSTKEVHVKRK